METHTPAVKLDWSRLLGFDQVPQGGDRQNTRDGRMVKLGAKIGVKKGIRRALAE